MSSSSSDSDDGEERKRLALAVDPDFVRSNIKSTNNDSKGAKNSAIKNGHDDGGEQFPSKRSKYSDDGLDSSEFRNPYNLSEGAKEFISKQLAKALDKSIKEVDTMSASGAQYSSSSSDALGAVGIKLFRSSKNTLCRNKRSSSGVASTFSIALGKRNQKKKSKSSSNKKKKDNCSSSSSEDETEKLKSVAVTAEWVHKQY